MNSSFMRKIEKAKDYALQRERVNISSCKAKFHGDNGDHTITYEAGKWHCDCDYHIGRETCVHIMAMEMILDGMAPAT